MAGLFMSDTSSGMTFRDSLEQVAKDYKSSLEFSFTNHELAIFIRQQFPNILRSNTKISDTYKLVGSPGKGNWAEIPWLCIFDKEITVSAQHGYYLVYLFDSEMETVSLCLSLGWTQFENQYGIKEGKVKIRQKAKFFQKYLTNRNFSRQDLDLNSKRTLGKGYELGCILKKTYNISELPSNSVLVQDLWSLIGIYEELKFKVGEDVLFAETGFYRDQYEIEEEINDVVKTKVLSKPKGQEVPTKKLLAGTTSFVPDLEVKAFVLQNANGVCEFCDKQAPFVTTKGRPYLDVHHVKWRSNGGSDKVENAIAVCPNCHMRFHHSEDKDEILEEVYSKIERLVRE